MIRRSLGALAIALACTPALAQTKGSPRPRPPSQITEFWPEIQLRYKVDPNTQATLAEQVKQNTYTGQVPRVETALSVSHRLTSYFAGGLGFRHINSADGQPLEEERLHAEQTLRVTLPASTLVDFRTTEELRWLLQGYSNRFRERVQVQAPVRVWSYTTTPYGSAELYYDTRFGQISHYVLLGGVTLPVKAGFSIQPAFEHQVFSLPRALIIDSFNLTMIASF